MIGFLRKHLATKILIAIVATVVLIMGAEIVVRIYFGTKDRIELINMSARELASSTYAGMKRPMAVGDAEAIVRQLSDIREITKDVEVFICDFDQEIIYSTHQDKLRTKLADSIHNPSALQTLGEILKTGIEPKSLFQDLVAGKRCFVYFYPVLNQKDCHHCHGASRKVLGSMAIRVSAERAYATVAAQRNRTIILTLLGLFLVVTLIYLIVSRLIRRPLHNLTDKARSFAEGDTSVSIQVDTEDEIGMLGKTFNYMVECVSTSNKKLEQEVTRKTTLLDERNRLITLLEKANRELRKLDKLKSTFLANMSHELRTPMNAIIGYTDLLVDGVDGPINEEQEKSLRKIASNSRDLLQLINDILDISKIESGKMQLSPKELDLKWLIESVLPAFEPKLKQKKLTVSHQIEEGLSLVYGDEEMLRHILLNLLSNAVKFTEKGEIRITAKISERGKGFEGQPIFAEICVADTGIGIQEEDLASIFDKFVQVDLTTVRQHEGTGLGLSIARGLVALHKGMIWATSTYGEGTQFYFTIPLSRQVFEGTQEPVTEPKMAEALADYFGKPVETFLKDPKYAGKPIRCWHYVRCGQPSCPAYGSEESRCWMILGTHCVGMKIASYPEKVNFCKGCELIENIILKADEESASQSVASTTTAAASSAKVVLAIDDNPDGIDIITKYLGDEYTVIGLRSGETAVEKAREIQPLAITLDLLMPQKDGWQVLRELKETPETQDIPVIIVSILDDKKLGFSLGAAEYIVKPLSKEVLLKKLKAMEKSRHIGRVLVVDNETEVVRRIGNILKDADYEVMTAYNSEDAIRSIKHFRPHLVVLSLTMPAVSGFDVIEYLKTRSDVKDLPLIALTYRDFSEKELEELNGRIHAILNRSVIKNEEDLSKELKDSIRKVTEGC